MEPINRSTPNCTCHLPASQFAMQASQTQLAAISSSRSIDLDLMTEEGDKVTLSFDAKGSALYAASGAVRASGDGVSVQWSELNAAAFERDLSLTVEGDLNRQERREIRKVLRTIHKMMNQFVKGKLDPMMSKAKKLEDLETIDNVTLSMSYERQVVIAQQSSASVAYDQFGQAAEAAAPRIESDAHPLSADAHALANDMANVIESMQAPRERLMEMTEHLFKAHRRRARRMHAMGGKVMDYIRDLFKAAVEGKHASQPAETVLTTDEDD